MKKIIVGFLFVLFFSVADAATSNLGKFTLGQGLCGYGPAIATATSGYAKEVVKKPPYKKKIYLKGPYKGSKLPWE
jgi:hypothetical protein